MKPAPCCYCSPRLGVAIYGHTPTDHCAVCMNLKCTELRCRLELDHLYKSLYSYLARTNP